MPPQSDLLDPISSDPDLKETNSDLSNNEPNSENPDLPPESFRLPKEQALDWFNRNAFMERKGSTKIGGGGGLAGTFNSDPRHSFHSSPSQRLSLNSKSKVSVIGLPKSQQSCFADGNLRRSFKPENVRLFRSRSEPGTKSEPGSPRVSCMGRVRSKKGREKRTGLWASLRAVFRTGHGANQVAIAKRSEE